MLSICRIAPVRPKLFLSCLSMTLHHPDSFVRRTEHSTDWTMPAASGDRCPSFHSSAYKKFLFHLLVPSVHLPFTRIIPDIELTTHQFTFGFAIYFYRMQNDDAANVTGQIPISRPEPKQPTPPVGQAIPEDVGFLNEMNS